MSNIALHIPDLIDRKKWKDYRNDIWGDSFNWSFPRTTKQVKHIVIHHTVTDHNASPDYIAQLHKNRGWGGIGYHFVVTKDGMVWYVGDVGMARANVLDKNELVIGIALVGDFMEYNPSDDQILSAHDLCKFFLDAPQWPNVNSWDDLVGHKELQATACPGSSWKGAPDSMYERIKNRFPYNPQTPPVNWKNKYEECSKQSVNFERDLEAEKNKNSVAQKTIDVLNEWKQKIAEELEVGVDWPLILAKINEEGIELDRLRDYESNSKLVCSKLNELLGRHFELPDDWKNLFSSLDEYKSLEATRKKEVREAKDKILELESKVRPITKLSWHEHLVYAIKKLIPFISA